MRDHGQEPTYQPDSDASQKRSSETSSSGGKAAREKSGRSGSRMRWLVDFVAGDGPKNGEKKAEQQHSATTQEGASTGKRTWAPFNLVHHGENGKNGYPTPPEEDDDDLDWEPFGGLDEDDDVLVPGEEEMNTPDAEPSAPSSPVETARPAAGSQNGLSGSEHVSASQNHESSPSTNGIGATAASKNGAATADLGEASANSASRSEDVGADHAHHSSEDVATAEGPETAELDSDISIDGSDIPGEGISFDGSTIHLSDDAPVADTNWAEKQASSNKNQEEDEPIEDLLEDPEMKRLIHKDRVVSTLIKRQAIRSKHLLEAIRKRKDDDVRDPLWRVLTTISGVDRDAIFAEAANVYAFSTAHVGPGKPDPEFARKVANTFDEEHREQLLDLCVLPYDMEVEYKSGAIKVTFITHDPTRTAISRLMQKLNLERFELLYAPESTVRGLIAEAFPKKNEYLERIDEEASNTYDLGMEYDEETGLVDEEALEAEMSRSKLINLFEATLVEATRQGASDVHIWPNDKKQVEIHFRLDGRLQRWHVEDKVHPEALIAVIKDNSMNVDRFERDAAQDGFIQRWIDDALIRFRVSVMPIANAASEIRSESIVIRVLDDRKVIKDLRKLGLQELAFERFKKAISQPHGMVILTGPTGSGKTTTLYAALHEVVSPEVNVLTVEDPVEYILPGVRQIKLNNKLGLEDALRSILRHDPDVVMVGEMRDRQTAELAIKLANTGHLTFSTLHTNDSASAVTRLYKMGIEPFLIAYAINLVVAQRLIRKLCTECRVIDDDPDPVMLKNLGFSPEEIATTTFYKAGKNPKCPKCGGLGYKGRRAVTEALYFTREMRHLIADSEGKLNEEQIKELALRDGMLTLQDSARLVVLSGETDAQEMMRVVASRD